MLIKHGWIVIRATVPQLLSDKLFGHRAMSLIKRGMVAVYDKPN